MKNQIGDCNASQRHPMTKMLLPLLGICLAVGIQTAQATNADISKLPPTSDKKGVTFEKDIRPILAQNCIRCHGERNPKGKLRLDSLEAVLKGGEDGKAVVIGNSTKSSIVLFTARLNEDDAMPPGKMGKPLTREEVGLIRAWIDQGAK